VIPNRFIIVKFSFTIRYCSWISLPLIPYSNKGYDDYNGAYYGGFPDKYESAVKANNIN
jgi:hypothetical protein